MPEKKNKSKKIICTVLAFVVPYGLTIWSAGNSCAGGDIIIILVGMLFSVMFTIGIYEGVQEKSFRDAYLDIVTAVGAVTIGLVTALLYVLKVGIGIAALTDIFKSKRR